MASVYKTCMYLQTFSGNCSSNTSTCSWSEFCPSTRASW